MNISFQEKRMRMVIISRTRQKLQFQQEGLFGKAPGRSTQRNMLPQSNSDFIFAIIIEEYGLLFGAIPLDSGIYDIAVQGNNNCEKMRNSISCLSGYGIDCYDSCSGNAEYAGCCGIIPGNRTDTSNGKLGKNIST